MTAVARKPKPVTKERLERGLDSLAKIIVDLGPDGPKCLPIYERLERELAAMQETEDKLAAIHARLKRSRDRTAA